MATKKTKSEEIPSGVSLTKKDSNLLVKKVGAVSDSTKALSKEIKSMTKIFADNQKVLLSMKEMIDTLTTTLEQIQKQGKQLNLLEEDSQRLYAGLNQVRSQADLVSKINEHTIRLQDQVNKITQAQKESPDSNTIMKAVSENQNSLQNNTHMIIKIARRIDNIKEDLESISSKADKALSVNDDLADLKDKVHQINDRAEKTNLESEIPLLKQSLSEIIAKTNETGKINNELESIKGKITSILTQADKIESLGNKVQDLQNELVSNIAKTESITHLREDIAKMESEINSLEKNADKIESLGNKVQDLQNELVSNIAKTDSITHLRGEIAKIDSEVNSLVKRADNTAFVGEGLKSVQTDFTSFKENILTKTNTIDQKISIMSDLLKRTDASSAEFHKKADGLFHDLDEIKSVTTKSSSAASKEVVGLLKLSEFQSNLRILAESKYGDLKEIEKMAEQTAFIINLFDKIAIESEDKVSLPQEIRRWAISKMFDCADKWEIRFSDLLNVLIDKLGREILKENIRIQQVRDIFGIRGVDETRKELNLSAS